MCVAPDSGTAAAVGVHSVTTPDMVKRTLVMSQRFLVLAVFVGLVGAGKAVCQSQRPAAGVVPGTQVATTHTLATHKDAVKTLPDAPSASVADQNDALADSAFERRAAFRSAARGDVALQSIASAPPNFALIFETTSVPKESGDFLSKFLVASLGHPNSRYQASSNDSWVGRATDAASSILVTRDESGTRRLNASYLVGVLTSVAAHSASRPYWLRSSSVPISDFGSTVGNDAGMNLLHEFGPGLREAVTGHMPSFVSRIQQRVTGERSPRPATLNAAR